MDSLAHTLARAARTLTEGMSTRCDRAPDIADYQAAFEVVLSQHPLESPAGPCSARTHNHFAR